MSTPAIEISSLRHEYGSRVALNDLILKIRPGEIPATGAHGPLRWVMALNSLTYEMAALHRSLYFDTPSLFGPLPAPPLCLAVVAIAALTLVAAASTAARGTA